MQTIFFYNSFGSYDSSLDLDGIREGILIKFSKLLKSQDLQLITYILLFLPLLYEMVNDPICINFTKSYVGVKRNVLRKNI